MLKEQVCVCGEVGGGVERAVCGEVLKEQCVGGGGG